MLTLPFHFLKFYFVESLIIFARIWHNVIMILEEDLAVGLMFRLLFVPLFHDSTIVGRVISFIFRITRIFYGLFALVLSTILVIICALIWYVSPILTIVVILKKYPWPLVNDFGPFFTLTLLFSLALFIHHLFHKPFKKIWQIKKPIDIWLTTKLKPKDIKWDKLIKSSEVQNLFQSLEFNSSNLSIQNIPLDDDIIIKTVDLAKKIETPYLTPAYFWVAMLNFVPDIETELLKYNLTLDDFNGALSYLEHKRQSWRKIFIWDEEFAIKHLRGINRGWLGTPTPALDQSSTDLTKQAAREGFEEFAGRGSIVKEIITILSQDKDRNVLIVGPAGSGKTSLVQYLAKNIVLGDAPKSLATKRLVNLQIPKLLANVKTEGDLAQKVKNIFEEVQFLGDIIIFVDEIHELGIGDAGSNFNLYSLMQPYLEADSFQFIGATEPENYARIIEKNSSFARIFHKVELPPATPEETKQIIFERSVKLARKERIFLSFIAIKTLVKGCARLIHDRVLPDSALSVLEECKASAVGDIITSETVKKVLEERVNVPIIELDQDQKNLLLNLEDVIHEELIDQEQAVKSVAETLRRGAVSLREQNRPIGSFLFVGPTGVGKTELAKILSETYFKSSGVFVRFDMSEYQTEEAVNRLIGTLENPGQLTEAIKNKPYALLLLDEFEKADPKILTLFLQVLDDGRLTDGRGTTIDFTNTIIIATSNIGSIIIAEGLQKGLDVKDLEGAVRGELLKVLKPELLNRFDSVVIFKPLKQQNLEKIVKIKLSQLQKMLKEQGYLVEFSQELISELAKKGFDPVMGARPLRRLIQDTLEAKFSQMILLNELKKGETLKADVELLS